MDQWITVAVGLLYNTAGQILVSRRPSHVDLGGFWEFPGGKQEIGEPLFTTLIREFREELGTEVICAEPWLSVKHDYPDKTVLLEVWQIVQWRGDPSGLEGQCIEWVFPLDLHQRRFPPADEPIISALLDATASRVG